jgi:hypothetical protein
LMTQYHLDRKRDIKHEIAEKQMKKSRTYCPSNIEPKQSSHGA